MGTKFKLGDKVKVIKCDDAPKFIGKIGRILEVDSFSRPYVIEFDDAIVQEWNKNFGTRLYIDSELEMAGKVIKLSDLKLAGIPAFNLKVAKAGIIADNVLDALNLLQNARVIGIDGTYLYGKKVRP